MASPPAATALCTARSSFRLAPHTVLLLLVAVLAAPRPTRSSSASPNAAVATFCSGQSPAAVTSGELASFLDALCAGAHGVAHMSHNMSLHVAEKNRTTYGVAQCRPDIPVPDCAACLAAASSRLISGSSAACAASAAVWHDACFLRYSDRDPGRFREDEHTATVFNASRAVRAPHDEVVGKAVVTRLLAAVGNRTVRSHMCRGVGSGTTRTAAGGGLTVYGLTWCAAGISCGDCRRCLRGALAVVEWEYNGSAGMQVLRLSCMARYESYPFYNATSFRLRRLADRRTLAADAFGVVGGSGVRVITGSRAAGPPTAQPTPAPPGGGGRTPQPPVAAPPPSTWSISVPAAVRVRGLTPPRAQPTPAPSGGHTHAPHPQPPPAAAASPADEKVVTQHSQAKTRKMPIILSVPTATGIVVIAVIVGLTLHRRRKQPDQMGYVIDDMRMENMHDQGKEQQSGTEVEDDDADTTSCQLYSYHVLEAATCHFSSSNKLGSGGFGTVFKGTLESGKDVAVKRLRDSKRNIRELEGEISIVADLRHKNLVRFLGYCFQEEGKFLVYDYVPNNSLANFWYRAPFQYQKLDWATWFNIILGVARGLRFLHEKGIIHRDLKPHNVLLDENFSPKIADFDLMRVYDKQKTHESTEKVAGTFGYMAPECTSGRKFLLSIKSDVYSYGVLMLEIITGHKIYTFEGQNSEGLVEYVWQHWTEKRAGDVVDGDLLGLEGEGQEHALRCVHVALLCVQADRARRPDMGQVIAMLRSDHGAELPQPSLPGYIVRSTTASGVRLRCMGYR